MYKYRNVFIRTLDYIRIIRTNYTKQNNTCTIAGLNIFSPAKLSNSLENFVREWSGLVNQITPLN